MSLELKVKSKLGTQGDSSAYNDISPRKKEEGKERARKGLEPFSVLLKEPAKETEQDRPERKGKPGACGIPFQGLPIVAAAWWSSGPFTQWARVLREQTRKNKD